MGKRKLTDSRRAYLRWRLSESRRKIKLKAIDYKGGKCNHCGYDKCVTSLHFHHINSTEKDFSISASKTRSFEKIKSELDKCDLLCSNCHLEEHERLRSAKSPGDHCYELHLSRKNGKEKAVNYKGGSCQTCGYNKTITGLCFHHLDPETKSFGVTGPAFDKPWDQIQSELDKCILLCGNCHGEIHDAEHQKQNQESYSKMRGVVPAKESMQKSTVKECYHCGKSITVYPSRLKDRNFCSRPCRDAVVNVKER